MYFVIYDLDDNVIVYIDNIDELLSFTGIRKNNFIRGIKNKGFYFYQVHNTYNKIYQFFE